MTMALVRPLRTLLRRDPLDRRLQLEALALLAVVRVALSLVPYGVLRRARRAVTRIVRVLPRGRGATPRVVDAVRIAARHVTGASCLTQAVALHLMLARRGVDSHLVVGVSRRDGRFAAHAWVDRDGEILIGGDVTGYAPLARLGRGMR